MSNLYINIRVWLYHFQVTDEWKVSISRNDYHRDNHDGFFRIYQFFN